MNLTRRQALILLANAASAVAVRGAAAQSSDSGITITPGPFSGTVDSLQTYQVPEWFADAKFGIWSHWGPQSAIGDGDWYARRMYIQGQEQYDDHLKRFGHPSKVGYKDLIPLFTADRWDPEHLMDLYVKAGAKYFFSMGVHHDNFDMWNSRHQPRWNAVAAGPKKDIVGLWAQAARKRGLRFGVSDHLSNSFDWYAPAHLSDSTGPLAGVPYDGANPQFSDLYHDYSDMPADFAVTAKEMGRVAPTRWKLEYFNRIKDLVDQHQPDLLYADGGIQFEEYGLSLVANLYNVSARLHGGKVEAVYNSKRLADCAVGTCVLDRERGVSDSIWPKPWQTDTCIGHWHYKKDTQYKSPKKVIDLLVDIVSKNGNLLLNFPLPASGELDAEERRVLQGITDWMSINSEGIHATRPWKIYGEGPSTLVVAGAGHNEDKKPDMGASDIRFTTKGKLLYAFVQGWPGKEVLLQSLGATSPQQPGKVLHVRMLGAGKSLTFSQENASLRVTLPDEKPVTADIGITLEMTMG
jgi:alpha-L-fucosidase